MRSVTAPLGLAIVLAATSASAQLLPRHSVSARGGTAAIGATMGHDCGSSVTPINSAVAGCALVLNGADTSPDLFYVDDDASLLHTSVEARTGATLSLPQGATVTYARLYWSARTDASTTAASVSLKQASVPEVMVAADVEWAIAAGADRLYQASADVTAYVAQSGEGAFYVSGVQGQADISLFDGDMAWQAWTLVVFYDHALEPFGHRALYDGFEHIQQSSTTCSLNLDVPFEATHGARLKTWVYDGDFGVTGDALSFDGTSLVDAANPLGDVFNGTRSWLGAAVCGVEDSPALSGAADSLSGLDLDVFDLTGVVAGDVSTATLTFSAGADAVVVGGAIVEIDGCADASDCGGATPVCNAGEGSCEACSLGVSGGPCLGHTFGEACVSDQLGEPTCGCASDADCAPSQTCDPAAQTCESVGASSGSVGGGSMSTGSMAGSGGSGAANGVGGGAASTGAGAADPGPASSGGSNELGDGVGLYDVTSANDALRDRTGSPNPAIEAQGGCACQLDDGARGKWDAGALLCLLALAASLRRGRV